MYRFTHLFLLHRFAKSIRLVRVKNFITGHHRDQILCITEVDDVMRPSGDHVDCLNLIARYFKLHHLTRGDVALLDQPVAMYHDELLPLAVVPVLTLCNTGLGDIDADLTAICCMHQLSKATTIVTVHLERIFKLLYRQIGQIEAEQLLCKTTFRHLRHQQIYRLCLELLQQIHNLTQRDLTGIFFKNQW